MWFLTEALCILGLSLICAVAIAQTSGDGARPADGAIQGGSILPGEKSGVPNKAPATGSTERAQRCAELSGKLREDCQDKERSAGTGASAPSQSDKADTFKSEVLKLPR
ncbi:MAG TPA: hypothetical protein VM183_00420 [Burkholderiales bacterium]|nr:hypothetical protein [Burkholderiales bacterium]